MLSTTKNFAIPPMHYFLKQFVLIGHFRDKSVTKNSNSSKSSSIVEKDEKSFCSFAKFALYLAKETDLGDFLSEKSPKTPIST
tara:strand:- start:1295 stop:1543 length:249 start_codon:yes stop_codon:yes gene_type:complete